MIVPLPSRPTAPHPTRRLLGRVALRNGLVAAAALVLLLVLLAGCGRTPLPAAAPSTIAPTTPVTPPPATPPAVPPTSGLTGAPDGGAGSGDRATPEAPRPGSPGPGGGAQAGTPIWPVSDAASARRLQQGVDGGRQPWLLDPAEVATAYAGSELGYRAPRAAVRGGGTVEVSDAGSPGRATVTLAQTVRRGAGGIWVVTAVQRR